MMSPHALADLVLSPLGAYAIAAKMAVSKLELYTALFRETVAWMLLNIPLFFLWKSMALKEPAAPSSGLTMPFEAENSRREQ